MKQRLSTVFHLILLAKLNGSTLATQRKAGLSGSALRVFSRHSDSKILSQARYELLFELFSVLAVMMLVLAGGEAHALSAAPSGLREQIATSDETPFRKGDSLLRVRLAVVDPDESSSVKPIGGHTHISTAVTPEIDYTYFLTDRMAVEFVLGIIRHKLKIKDTRLGDLDAGHSTAIAPTISLQYHYPVTANIIPYLGAGASYVYYIADNDDADVDYTDDISPLLQAGIDWRVTGDWFANLDVKKSFVTTVSTRPGSPLTTETDVDPWVFSAGIGYRF